MSERIMYRIILMIGFIFLFVVCNANSNTDTSQQGEKNNDIELTEISNTKTVDQQPSNQAKQVLQKYTNITKVKAANTSKLLLIAIDIKHSKRFSLKKTEQYLAKKMKKEFPDMKVEFSTDQKIVLELDQLEKDLQANKVSNKKLKKRLKKLAKLKNEKT